MYFCTFYSSKLQYKLAATRLYLQLKKINSIKKSYIINEKNFFSIIKNNYPLLYDNFNSEKNSIGFAFWAWKPIIILHILEKIPESSILLYADVGCNLEKNDIYWKKFLDRVNNHNLITANSVGFGVKTYGAQERTWTKPEIFDSLKLDERHQRTSQYQATWIAIKKNNTNLEIIRSWIEYCTKDNFYLVRPESEFLSSGSNFISNRADQSVFSCLLKSRSINLITANSEDMENIKASRNLSVFGFYGNSLPLVQKIIKKLEREFVKIFNTIIYR